MTRLGLLGLLVPLVAAGFGTDLFAQTPVKAASPQGLCTPQVVEQLLRRAMPQQIDSVSPAPCGCSVRLRLPNPQEALFWFSYSPTGDLQTSLSTLSCDSSCRHTVQRAEQQLIALLEPQTSWASCPLLQCDQATPPPEATLSRTATPRALSQANPSDSNYLVSAIYVVDAIAWVVLAAVLLILLVTAAPKNKKATALAACVALAGLALRLLSSPRLPMSHALLDFEQMSDVLTILDGSFVHQETISPLYLPSQGLLTAFWAWTMGLSVNGVFCVTTAVGTSAILVAYRVGLQLTGRLAGALFCGLAVAVSPINIMFSNGYDTGTLAGTLVILNISFFIDNVKSSGWVAFLGHTSSLVLLANCRGESLALAGWIGGLEALVLIYRSGRLALGSFRSLLATFGSLLLAGVWLLPLLFGLLQAMHVQDAGVVGRASGSFGWALLAGVLWLLPAHLLCRCPSHPFHQALHQVFRWFLACGGVALAATLLSKYGLEALAPHSFEEPGVPFVQFFVHRQDLPLGQSLGLLTEFLGRPALFPTLWLPPLLFALAPTVMPAEKSLTAFAWLAASWLSLFGLLLHQMPDGLLTLSGARYMLTALPLLMVVAGLGAFRMANACASKALRTVVLPLLALLLAAPAITHYHVYSDTIRNPQSEYIFAQRVAKYLDKNSVVIIPDHGLSGELEDGTGAVPIQHYRTWLMYKALAHFAGIGDEGISSLSELPNRADLEGKRLLVAHTGDCYRHTSQMAEASVCQQLSRLPEAVVLVRAESVNRIMTEAALAHGYGPGVPTLPMELEEVPQRSLRSLLDIARGSR